MFYSDLMAAGGQTLAFKAALTEHLAQLQLGLTESLVEHVYSVADEGLPAFLRHGAFVQSWRRYGFPFVGAHWVPHFTVASLPSAPDDPEIAEFLRSPAPRSMNVERVSWWRVMGNRSERLAWIPLAPVRMA